jgi:Uma2 family endonuclease
MLHNLSSNYKELARLAGLTGRPSSSERNKQKLLEMAKEGKARPKANAPLGGALRQYTCKSSGVYCFKFDRQIRKIAPDWFASQQNRKLLLEMAKKGKPKPNRNTPLGRALVAYMKCRHRTDLELIKSIKKFAPNWLERSSERKKQILLEMAKRGEPKPHRNKHPLGSPLVYYTNKKSGSYDPAFTKQIKKLAPHWFKKKAL